MGMDSFPTGKNNGFIHPMDKTVQSQNLINNINCDNKSNLLCLN